MKLKLIRTNSSKNSTNGLLYNITSDPDFRGRWKHIHHPNTPE